MPSQVATMSAKIHERPREIFRNQYTSKYTVNSKFRSVHIQGYRAIGSRRTAAIHSDPRRNAAIPSDLRQRPAVPAILSATADARGNSPHPTLVTCEHTRDSSGISGNRRELRVEREKLTGLPNIAGDRWKSFDVQEFNRDSDKVVRNQSKSL